MATEAQIKANKKFNAKMRGVSIRLNPQEDAVVLDRLDNVPNKTEYIKQLILRDIAENSK